MTNFSETNFIDQSITFEDTPIKSQLTPQFLLSIQEEVNHLISKRRPYIHLSLNPLGGNTLY
jgi:hypothetical protein